MDMRVDAGVVRSERTRRAWSQEHLANAAGLGLRTVQRIESTGIASSESVIALASVFSIPVSSITIDASTPRARFWSGSRRKLGAAGAVALAILISVLAIRTSFADQILLDIGFSLNDDTRVVETRMMFDAGKGEALEPDGFGRFVITPSITEEGFILIELQIYEHDGADYVMTRGPRVLTKYGTPAEVVFGTDEGQLIRVRFTPDRP
jgi:transcriptional regulator with XRE-family HTH domain